MAAIGKYIDMQIDAARWLSWLALEKGDWFWLPFSFSPEYIYVMCDFQDFVSIMGLIGDA